MLRKCQKCGVLFKTDNSQSNRCYWCESKVELIPIFTLDPSAKRKELGLVTKVYRKGKTKAPVDSQDDFAKWMGWEIEKRAGRIGERGS